MFLDKLAVPSAKMEEFTSAEIEEVQQFLDGRILPSVNNVDDVKTGLW